MESSKTESKPRRSSVLEEIVQTARARFHSFGEAFAVEATENSLWFGIACVIVAWLTVVIFSLLMLKGLDFKNLEDHAYRWWQCGVFCSTMWTLCVVYFHISWYSEVIRMWEGLENYRPSLRTVLGVSSMSMAAGMGSWTLLYYIGGKSFFWFSGFFYGSMLWTIVNALCVLMVPAEVEKTKVIVVMGCSVLWISIVMVHMSALVLYNHFNQPIVILALFGGLQWVSTKGMHVILEYFNALTLRPAAAFLIGLTNRLVLVFCLVSGDVVKSCFTAFFCDMVAFSFTTYGVLCDPIRHGGSLREKVRYLLFSETRPLTDEESKKAKRQRDYCVKVMLLELSTEIIMPIYCLFYYLFAHTYLGGAPYLAGMSSSMYGYDKFDGGRMKMALAILVPLELVVLLVTTVLLRRSKEFEKFNPLRVLSLQFSEKPHVLMSCVAATVVTSICLAIHDCHNDLSTLFGM